MSAAPIGVLVVDDEPLLRWALSEALTSRGCEVVQAGDARTAIQAMGDRAARQFDVVVLDYHLPDAHDLGLLTTTRRVSPHSHVIMLTALMPPEEIARALALGASHVVQKPIEMEVFTALVLEADRAAP